MKRSHSDLIETLGGATKVAELLSAETGEDVDREAIYKWRKLNRVPWRWRPHVAQVAKRSGVKVPAGFLTGVAA